MDNETLLEEINKKFNEKGKGKAVIEDYLIFGKHLIYRKIKYVDKIE